MNDYGKSKKDFEEFALSFGKKNKVNVIGLRYCNVYGPGEAHKGNMASMIYQLAKQIKDNKNPKIFEYGQQKRDWIYVKDVVQANMKALEFKGVDIVNCGCGIACTFNELVALVNKHLKTNFKPQYIENPFQSFYQEFTQCDIKKAQNLLDFVPSYDLDAGIKDYLNSTEFKH